MSAVSLAARLPAGVRRTAVRARRAPRRLGTGTLRTIGWIRGAARAYDASASRIAVRAARLRLRGWRVGDLALLGLLDPVTGPAAEGWALRRSEFLRLQEQLNPAAAVPTAEDKALFAAVCAEHGIATAPVLAVLERSPDAESTAASWAAILRDCGGGEIVVKPTDGALGSGLHLLHRTEGGLTDSSGRRHTWEEMAGTLARASWDAFVVQPRLRTHPELARISGHDVLQCLRIVTLLDADGHARVLYTVLRIAAGQAQSDAFRAPRGGSTGNLLARVEEDGRLATPVGVAPGGFGLLRPANHPDTGLPLAGFAVPQVAEAHALAVRAAEAFSPLRTIGWDIAPTSDGPIVLEGNAWWGATGDPDGALLPVRSALRAAVAAEVAASG